MRVVTLLGAAGVAAAFDASATGPQQIHLAYTGKPSEMLVSWAVPGECGATATAGGTVHYGESKDSLDKTAAAKESTYLSVGDQCQSWTLLDSLESNKKYFYKISSGDSSSSLRGAAAGTESDVFSFTADAKREGGKIYAVLADFGLTNDLAMKQLVSEAQSGVYDVVIHAGDFAYDLETTKGTVGNTFLNALQGSSAIVPYMTTVGNHESDKTTFEQYLTRFGPALKTTAKNSGSSSPLWYSFNDGLVHWVAIDTELFAYGGTKTQIADQYNWLKKDLAAVDRSQTPWVIAFGHKQAWMDKVTFTELNDIMQAGGVDMYICGHQHNYQRLLPVASLHAAPETDCMSNDNQTYTDCKNMITMVVGSPGCKEGINTGHAPAGLAEFYQAYGFGQIQVVDANTLSWKWEEVAQGDKTREDRYADVATIIQHNHGPRQL